MFFAGAQDVRSQPGKLEGGAPRRLREGSREVAPPCARYELRLRYDV